MKKALIATAFVGTLSVSGIIGYAASSASQPTTGVKSAVTDPSDGHDIRRGAKNRLTTSEW